MKQRKLIFIVKKETNNLERLKTLFINNPDLSQKKVLFIDDEADYASIGFKRDRNAQDGITINVIAQKINSIRQGFENNYCFLQVTATPNALYLQPEGAFELNSDVFEPTKPAFTVLVPIPDEYIGGTHYFEESQDPESPYSKLYIRVPDKEISVLNNQDQRYISNIITTPNLAVFRMSIMNFLVGGAIRMIQRKKYKCSFVVHASREIELHQWQSNLVKIFLSKLTTMANEDNNDLIEFIETSYLNLKESVILNNGTPPSLEEVKSKVIEALTAGYIGITEVNSENQIAALLDRSGQLKLNNPFNIFIGGQVLDRGITIENF